MIYCVYLDCERFAKIEKYFSSLEDAEKFVCNYFLEKANLIVNNPIKYKYEYNISDFSKIIDLIKNNDYKQAIESIKELKTNYVHNYFSCIVHISEIQLKEISNEQLQKLATKLEKKIHKHNKRETFK